MAATDQQWNGQALSGGGKNTYAPMNGEALLESNPEAQYQFGSSNVANFRKAGSSEAQQNQAFNDFVSQFGRNPTQSELNMLSSAYAGDPNSLNVGQGKQTLSQYYNNLSNTPANIYATQQKQWSADAPSHYDAVNQIIQSSLGRAATQDELNHYGTLISSGQADPFQIQQFVQATPEYQNTQDTNFRKGVDTQLQQSDSDFFNTQKGNIAQQYAQMGRATSPALDVALTQLASSLKSNRDSYLATLSASQYGSNKTAALTDYGKTQDQVQSQINQNTAGIYGNNQALNTRLQNITDYNTQANAWSDAQSRYSQKPNWMDYLNTGANVVNAGAKAYAAA